MGRRDRRKLRLHRETLRTVSGPELDRVAGGDFVAVTSRAAIPNLLQINPKTNGWSGDPLAGCNG